MSNPLMPPSQPSSQRQLAATRPVVVPWTDPRPWIHQRVRIVAHKGHTGKEGIVCDVTVNHKLKGSKSGILVNLALQVPGSLQVVNIDYDQLRDERGDFLKLPINPNSAFQTKRGSIEPVGDASIFDPAVLMLPTDMEWVNDLRNMVQLSEVAVMVDIVSGAFKGQNKFVYMNDIPGHVGLHKARSAKTSSTPVPMGLLAPSSERPLERTETRLMLVVKGKHTGKFVRRIGMRYRRTGLEPLFVLRVVQLMGEQEANRVSDEEMRNSRI
ncbi:hypothetical protein MPER_11686 [Moniliophthora perniciosa FA553]|nr:hypothetical protein MPER_11686 [Moniliophthora perniciosa FA553]